MPLPAVWSRVLQFSSVATAAVALVSLVPGDSWLVSLLSNLRLHLLIAAFVLFIANLVTRQWFLSAALGGLTVWALFVVQPQFGNRAISDSAGVSTLKIATYNLSFTNHEYPQVRRYLSELPTDIVVLQEYTFDWQKELATLRSSYPYVIDAARNDAFGIALMSRIPLQNARIEWFPGRGTPYTRAVVNYDGHEIDVFGLHLAWPMTPAAFAARNRQIDHLAEALRDSTGTTLACGDFNLTNWSPWFAKLLVQGKVSGIDALSKHAGTWPAPFSSLGIAIDHCLVSAPGSITRKTRGPNLGSDHELTTFEVTVAAEVIQ